MRPVVAVILLKIVNYKSKTKHLKHVFISVKNVKKMQNINMFVVSCVRGSLPHVGARA